MRKSELKLKTMRRKSIESFHLDAWLFSFGIINQACLGCMVVTPISFPVCYCITPAHGWQSGSVKIG